VAVDTTDRAGLANTQVQLTLLAETAASATVGMIVWDEDRRYIAANARACELLACTLEELLGSVVGSRTADGKATVERVVRGESRTGELEAERFDGQPIRLSYLTFETRTAGLPYMASIIWPAPAA
jgi:PAS domain-containing protein